MTFARGRKDSARRAGLARPRGTLAPHAPQAVAAFGRRATAGGRGAALANRPKLLLADEPTANVDPANQQNVIDLIRGTCKEEGVALIVVTHATEVAGQFERVDRLEDINRVARQVVRA